MALTASTVWELRPSVGNDANGGAFDLSVTSPGTDRSQQNSAQFSGSDGTAAGTTAFTSASHTFTSADVGNVLNLSSGSGFTAGFYTIVSVATGIATLDRSPGTGTAGVWALGGALATLRPLLTSSGYGGVPNAVLANVVYIKNTGTITLTSAISIPNLGYVALIGYGTTRGDSGQVTITTSTNSIHLFVLTDTNASAIFENIIFTSTAGTPGNALDAGVVLTTVQYNNCFFSGFSQIFAITAAHIVMFNCEVTACVSTTSAIFFVCQDLYFHACYIHNNTGAGVRTFTGSVPDQTIVFIDCVIAANAAGVINTIDGTQVSLTFVNCAITDNTGDGINAVASAFTAQTVRLTNCTIDGNGGFGVHCALPTSSGTVRTRLVVGAGNAFRSNTSGDRSNFPVLRGDITLTADPFTNRSGGDFSLNSTAGGGAACKAAGFQSTLIG